MLYAFKLGRKLRGEEPYCPEKGGKGGSSDKSAKYAADAQKYARDRKISSGRRSVKTLLRSRRLRSRHVNQLRTFPV